jgi:hypothetical protein
MAHTTEKLIQDIIDYETGKGSVGFARQARHLLRVAEGDRTDVSLLGNYFCNTIPGYRPSDATQRAVELYLANGIEYVKAYGRDAETGLRR